MTFAKFILICLCCWALLFVASLIRAALSADKKYPAPYLGKPTGKGADFEKMVEKYNAEQEEEKERQNPLNNPETDEKLFVVKSGGIVRHFRTVAEKVAYLEGRGEIQNLQGAETEERLQPALQLQEG